jgi:hypothetical protein
MSRREIPRYDAKVIFAIGVSHQKGRFRTVPACFSAEARTPGRGFRKLQAEVESFTCSQVLIISAPEDGDRSGMGGVIRGWLAFLNSGAGILSLAANIEALGRIIARRSGS